MGSEVYFAAGGMQLQQTNLYRSMGWQGKSKLTVVLLSAIGSRLIS
jgi:hypothetical protein